MAKRTKKIAKEKTTRRTKRRNSKSIFSRVLKVLEYGIYSSCVLGLLGLACVIYIINDYAKGLPDIDELFIGYDTWSLSTQVFASDGSVIGEFYEENRRILTIDQIPMVMRQAIIAVEDERFDRNNSTAWVREAGIDPIGIARAAIANLMAGKTIQGGSTITQQITKNLFLTKDRTLKRKIQEMIMAYRIEKKYSRDEILERYLNYVFFGNQAYGLHSAALRYFAVDLEKSGATLTTGQAAMIAGLAKAPSAYAPHRHPERAKKRQRIVLNRMAEVDYIDASEIDSAVETFWTQFDKDRVTVSEINADEIQVKVEQAGYFLEYVRRELVKILGDKGLYRGGYRVTTTLDPKLQIAAEVAMKRGLDRLTGELEKSKKADLTKGPLEGALVSIDHKTGRILSMVGGSSWGLNNQFNRAFQAKRQAGSSFKPIVYYQSLASNGSTLGTVLQDWRFVMQSGPDTWSPGNYSNKEYGPVLPRTAMRKSLNISSVRMLTEHGDPYKVVDVAKSLGFDVSAMGAFPSLALGAVDVSPLEMAVAYGTIANQGVRVDPHPIIEIRDRMGRIVRTFEPSLTYQSLDNKYVFLVGSLLETVVRRGTGASAVGAVIGDIPAAGKT